MENLVKESKVVEFHIGRGGRFNNAGYLTFKGVGSEAKSRVESDNFLGFEFQNEVIENLDEDFDKDEVIEIFSDLDHTTKSEAYKDFTEKYGDLGCVVVNSGAGNFIGDYKADGEDYRYEEDSDYDTTYGVLAESFEDLSEEEQTAILRSDYASDFETAFNIDLSDYREE